MPRETAAVAALNCRKRRRVSTAFPSLSSRRRRLAWRSSALRRLRLSRAHQKGRVGPTGAKSPAPLSPLHGTAILPTRSTLQERTAWEKAGSAMPLLQCLDRPPSPAPSLAHERTEDHVRRTGVVARRQAATGPQLRYIRTA